VKTSRLVFLIIIIIFFVSSMAIWFYPSVQAFMDSNTLWNGTNNFSKEFNVQNIDSIADLPEAPVHDVLIVVPYLPYNDIQLAQIKKFVDDGGKLIIMDDFGYGNSLLAHIGIQARFDNVPLLDPLFSYKNEYFPRILNFNADVTNSDVKSIAFNHGTALNSVSQNQALAWSSNTSFLDVNRNGNYDPGEPQGPFAVAASLNVGRGTVDLISDSSLIMNVVPGNNDNKAFVDYLINSNGTPDKILFDRSQVTKSSLDALKIKLVDLRAVISNPYTLVGMIALVFVIITWYIYRRGLLIG
jgi:hypothetical protein